MLRECRDTNVTIVAAHLTADARWRIHRHDPVLHELQAYPDWAFINPLVYPQVAYEAQTRGGRYRLGEVVDDAILIETNVLIFQVTHDNTSAGSVFGLAWEQFMAQFLAHLRYQSKQVELARVLYGGGPFSERPVSMPTPTFPALRPNDSAWVMNFQLQTAITWSHVEQADAGMLQGDPPLYGSILCDAVLAFLDRDDRRTVLYAAMAVETIAKTMLSAGGSLLGQKQRSEPTALWLLHRQSSAVLGRSLKTDDPALFRQAERLFRTRNGLVHEGTWPQRGDVLPPDGEGAFHALPCANAVFAWFGESGDYMPAHGAVVGEIPEGWTLDLNRGPGFLPRAYS